LIKSVIAVKPKEAFKLELKFNTGEIATQPSQFKPVFGFPT